MQTLQAMSNVCTDCEVSLIHRIQCPYGNSLTDPRHIYTTTCDGEAQGDWIILTAPHTVCTLCNTHTSAFSEKNRLVSASPLEEILGGRDQSAMEFATAMQYSNTAVEALCASLAAFYVLFVRVLLLFIIMLYLVHMSYVSCQGRHV